MHRSLSRPVEADHGESDTEHPRPWRTNSEAMRRYLAEASGTFFLVIGGVGAAVLAGDRIGFLGVAFAFGLSLLTMVYAIGPISGCHINPAVTVGLLLAGGSTAGKLPGYSSRRCVGGDPRRRRWCSSRAGRAGGLPA